MKILGIIILLLGILSWAHAQPGSTTFFDNKEFAVELQKFNSVASDISPVFVDGKLYFSSVREKYFEKQSRERKNKAFYDMYEVSLDTKGYATSERRLVEGFGSKYHEGPAAWCEATGELFVTLSNILHPDTLLTFIPMEHIRLRLAIKKKTGESWEITEELPFNNKKFHFAHPAVSITGDTLVFSSDVDSVGYGKSDLYMSVRRNGKWSDPQNLGPKVNTSENEMYPVFGPDGMLLFSSDGHKNGLGQLDIYRTAFPQSDTVINLGDPINTAFDDFGLVIHSGRKVGYLASGRSGAGDDIYRLDIISKSVMLAGHVLDDLTGDPVPGASVHLQDCRRGIISTLPASDDGGFMFEITEGECYFVEASKDGYEPGFKDVTGLNKIELQLKRQVNYTLIVMDLGSQLPLPGAEVACNNQMKWVTNAGGAAYPFLKKGVHCDLFIGNEGYVDQTLTLDMSQSAGVYTVDTVWLFRPELYRVFALKNIYYDFGKWHIRPDAQPPLDNLVDVMKQYPFNVELSGHTDNRGENEYNMLLSQRRADAAVDYIVNEGISPSRLTARGYGGTRLVNSCFSGAPCTEAMHQENRRTEFMITSFLQGEKVIPVKMKNDTVVIGSSKIHSHRGYETHGVPAGQSASETYFTVQVLASVVRINLSSEELLGEKDIFEKKISPYFKYYQGKFDNYQDARNHRNKLSGKFKGCFVVAFKEGSVVSTKELQEHLK
jgi:outer membrane protein OmpA-like peptidoglycan-associated protein